MDFRIFKETNLGSEMEITNYKLINKGCLLAKFDVSISDWGLTIRDCGLFEKDGRKWISLPNRQYQSRDGLTKNFDYVVFDQKMRSRFEKACLEKIQNNQFGSKKESSVPF